MRVLFVLLVAAMLPPVFAAGTTGLEVSTLAWDYPTVNVKGDPLPDAIQGSNVYCNGVDGSNYSTTINVPAPVTTLPLSVLAVPDGTYECTVDVYVILKDGAEPLRSGKAVPVSFFAAAGTWFSVDPDTRRPSPPMNIRVE